MARSNWLRRLCKKGVKTQAEQLQEAVKPLKLLNNDTSVFTPTAVISLFLFVKQYIRYTRMFLSISDPMVMKETALAAARAGVFDPSKLSVAGGQSKLGPADVLKISEWMKSAEGGSCMRFIYRRRKLEKKVQNLETTMVESVPVCILSTQLHEYKAEIKEIDRELLKEKNAFIKSEPK